MAVLSSLLLSTGYTDPDVKVNICLPVSASVCSVCHFNSILLGTTKSKYLFICKAGLK